MSLRILIDMNLSPDWEPLLSQGGFAAMHWSAVGDPAATDRFIMDWARAHEHVVLTHDLDFGTILALTQAAGPSVIQVRAKDPLPDAMGGILLAALRQCEQELAAGALVVIHRDKLRVRVLPL